MKCDLCRFTGEGLRDQRLDHVHGRVDRCLNRLAQPKLALFIRSDFAAGEVTTLCKAAMQSAQARLDAIGKTLYAGVSWAKIDFILSELRAAQRFDAGQVG